MTSPPKPNAPPGGQGGARKSKGLEHPSSAKYRKIVTLATIADETAVHVTIREWLDLVLPAGSRVFHPANGELRDKATAAKLKRLGVKPGVPDLVIVSRGARVAFIEVKRGKGGRLSPEQAEFKLWCIAHGVPYAVCRSVDDARLFLASLDIETREAAR